MKGTVLSGLTESISKLKLLNGKVHEKMYKAILNDNTRAEYVWIVELCLQEESGRETYLSEKKTFLAEE